MKNRSRRVSYRARRTGFTLIELLTVIAIIAVLASFSFAGVSRYLEKSKETKTVANMDFVSKSLMEYSARASNTTGYPLAYGYILPEAREKAVGTLVDADFMLQPYTAFIGLHDEESSRQLLRYLRSYDVNRNGAIDLLEYLPVGSKDAASGSYTFSATLYDGGNTPMSGAVDEVAAQLDNDRKRPYVYIPYKQSQLKTARRYWVNQNDEFGASFDITDSDLDGRMFFPPAQYDAFVLIANGPGGNDGGVVADPPAPVGGGYDGAYAYHVAALRTAFLATRDWDPDGAGALEPDGLLDFDYKARQEADTPFILPDGTRGYGPFIKVVD